MAKTVTISVTLTQAELKLAEKLAKEHGLPLAQCVKQFRLCDQVFEEHFETLKRRAAAQPARSDWMASYSGRSDGSSSWQKRGCSTKLSRSG